MLDCTLGFFLAKTQKLNIFITNSNKKITCKDKTLRHLDHHMHENGPLQVLYFWKQQPQQCKLLAQLTTAPLEYRISTLNLEQLVRLSILRTIVSYKASDKRHKSNRYLTLIAHKLTTLHKNYKPSAFRLFQIPWNPRALVQPVSQNIIMHKLCSVRRSVCRI